MSSGVGVKKRGREANKNNGEEKERSTSATLN